MLMLSPKWMILKREIVELKQDNFLRAVLRTALKKLSCLDLSA
jgi:hypothetical protein